MNLKNLTDDDKREIQEFKNLFVKFAKLSPNKQRFFTDTMQEIFRQIPRKKSEREINLKEQQFYIVRFAFEPKTKLLTYDFPDAEIDVAVTEAEFLAKVLESELVTENLAMTIRALLFGSCLYFAESLEYYKPDPQMIRDIYPFGRMVKKEIFSAMFDSFLIELSNDAPELYKSFFGGQEND